MTFHAIRKEVIDEWDKAIRENRNVGDVMKAVLTRLESLEQRVGYLEQRQVRDK